MITYSYPPTPANVDKRILSPSVSFKKNVGIVLISILLFFIVYVLLVIAAIAFAIGCVYFGIWLVSESPRFFTIMICLGLTGLGISVFVFLVKFIFSVSKNVNDSRIEIKEKDQPELFAFIRKLTKETKTPFPKKIFLSSEVNASVFYNSSFWSMFFPVRKNLEIGLGLMNCISVSEFKAVVAHEFGHFSQRSMKLGSFTYNVNRIIYNMLYDNTGYSSSLNSWARVSGYFAFFAKITVGIAGGIQSILKSMYTFINKSYMGLSREMEFHADAVAASVSGGNNLVTALSRLELASNSYNTALHNADYWLKQNKASKNIFKNQLTILRSLAKEHRLPLQEGLPQISFQFIQSFSQSRINYKDQWASHPSLEERKQRLEQLQTDVLPDHIPAVEILNDVDKLQELMTINLYKNAKVNDNLDELNENDFEDWYTKEREAAQLPLLYKGFYDKRFTNVKVWDIDALTKTTALKKFDELFNEENGQLQSSITNNENDINTVKAIKEKQIDVKNFDFDGTKHDVHDCDNIIIQLEEDIAAQTKTQESLDKEAFVFFYEKASENKDQLINGYKHYQSLYNQYDDYAEVANKILGTINPFYHGQNNNESIRSAIKELTVHEKKLKEFFKKLLADKVITPGSGHDLYKRATNFIETDYAYFALDVFRDEELNELSDLTLKIAGELNEQKFGYFKKLLEDQLKYYSGN